MRTYSVPYARYVAEVRSYGFIPVSFELHQEWVAYDEKRYPHLPKIRG